MAPQMSAFPCASAAIPRQADAFACGVAAKGTERLCLFLRFCCHSAKGGCLCLWCCSAGNAQTPREGSFRADLAGRGGEFRRRRSFDWAPAPLCRSAAVVAAGCDRTAVLCAAAGPKGALVCQKAWLLRCDRWRGGDLTEPAL